jgi:hypothetical protein
MGHPSVAAGVGGLLAILTLVPAWAQSAPAKGGGRVATAAEQIAEALLPLPDSLRAGAGVVGLGAAGRSVTLKPSVNHLVCRRIWPGEEPFDVRCYHEAFWPVVDRMLALKAERVGWDDLVLRIHGELERKRLSLPPYPTAGYRMLGPLTAYDSTAHAWTGAMERWQSLHVPFQAAAVMGLAIDEQRDMPYVMASGTFWAHLMFEHSR